VIWLDRACTSSLGVLPPTVNGKRPPGMELARDNGMQRMFFY